MKYSLLFLKNIYEYRKEMSFLRLFNVTIKIELRKV